MCLICFVQSASPAASSTPVVHSSPKVAEYIRSLPRKSPRKSPLSKYLRLRNRSPLKPTLHSQLVTKRVRLDFSDADQGGVSNMQPEVPSSSSELFPAPMAVAGLPRVTVSVVAPQPTLPPKSVTNQLSSLTPQSASQSSTPPSAHLQSVSASSSPTLMSVMQVHSSKAPEVVQLSRAESPPNQRKFRVVTVPKNSLEGCGSFGSLVLPNLFSAASESVCHKQKPGESSSRETHVCSPRGVSKPEARSPTAGALKKPAAATKSQSPSSTALDSRVSTALSPIGSPTIPVKPPTSSAPPVPTTTSVNAAAVLASRPATAVQAATHGSLHSLLMSALASSHSPAETTASSSSARQPQASLPASSQIYVIPAVSQSGSRRLPPAVSHGAKTT